MDVIVLISNCPQLNNPCNAYNPTPMRVMIWDTRERMIGGCGTTVQICQAGRPGFGGLRMFNKVLIANRGAIACRIIRTLRRMGIGSVAVYSDADRARAARARRRTRRLRRPGRRPRESYLRAGRASSRPRASAAREAIHPGYGFLSARTPRSPRRCEAARHRLHRADARADAATSA